jgi:hypothetical protein
MELKWPTLNVPIAGNGQPFENSNKKNKKGAGAVIARV